VCENVTAGCEKTDQPVENEQRDELQKYFKPVEENDKKCAFK
jgi:hypothetical protein